MERYFKPPEPKGRPLNILSSSRGKKHYWGQKGKNYGFFTAAEEEDMEKRRREHRRIRSEAYNYYSDNAVRYRNPFDSKRTLPTEIEEYGSEHYRKTIDRNYSTVGVQAEDIPIQSKDIGIDAVPSLRQQMQSCLQKPKNQTINPERFYLENKTNSNLKLPQINNKGDYVKTEPSLDNKRPSVRFLDTVEVLNAQPASKPKKKEHIVYYTRRNRLNNPTFCNSPGYPLPCYRYAL